MTQAIRSLPARPHLGYLKKLAKQHLAALRARRPETKLAAAQLAVAREHGFASWRALKAHVDRIRLEISGETSKLPPAATPIEEFIEAAIADFRSGTLKRAQELLKANPVLATADIYTACLTGNERRIKELLRENPSLAMTAGGPRGWTPLLYLCYSRYLRLSPRSADRFARCGRILLEHGADPNSFWMHDTWRETALYGASGIANCAPLTKVLLDAGADPNKPDLETLYHTAEFSDHACLKLVLAKMPRCDWLNYCMAHKLDMEDPAGLQLFLDHGADPNYLGLEKTAYQQLRPIHFAILRHRSAKIIRALLNAGADPNLADGRGITPLAQARRLGHAEAARVLRAAGAADRGDAREEAIAAIMSGNAKAARRSIPDAAAFVRSLSEDEQKLLPYAAEAGNLKAVRLMLDLGWDIETPGEWNGTALHQAIYHGHVRLVEFLLSRRARIDHKNAFGGDAMGTAVHAALHNVCETGPVMVKLIASRQRGQDLSRYIESARAEGNARIARILEKLS
jgi:ankyrin repeat protein